MNKPDLALRLIRKGCAARALRLGSYIFMVWLSVSLPVQAQALENGGVIHGSIAVEGQQNSYTFSATAGETILVRIGDTNTSDNMQPVFRVLKPTGALVEPSSFPEWSDQLFVAPASGVYTVVVGDSANNSRNGVGPYDLHFAKKGSGGTLANGGKQSAFINVGDLHTYVFTAAAGEMVVLRIGDTNTSDSMQPVFLVLTPAGALVEQSSFPEWGSQSFVAPTTGLYTVVVSDSTNNFSNGTGPYDLYFAKRGANSKGTLTNGGTRSGQINIGELATYAFYAEAGETAWIRIGDTRTSDNMQPAFRVLSPSGAPVGSSSGNGEYENQVFATTASGVYTVVVADSGTNGIGGTGPYELHFAKNGANSGGALVNGGARSGYISIGDLDSYTFYAAADETVSIHVGDIDTSDNMQPIFRVLSPAGAQVLSSNGGAEYENQDFVAATSGIYTVVVADGGNNGITGVGPYSLSLSASRKAFSYAALGDSYSSGEGLKPYLGANDVWYWTIGCHRSNQAYSYKIKLPWDTTPIAQRKDAQFDFFACSGAVTDYIPANGESWQEEPPQMWSGNAINSSRDLVTLTIGGNDAQFVRIFLFCLMHSHCQDVKPFLPHSDYTLSDLSASILLAYAGVKINNVHQTLKDATPNAATVVFGYPILVSGKECPALAIPGMPDAKLSADEQEFLRNSNRALNEVIAASAATVGLHFIPVSQAFEGHEVCDDQENWVNGLVLSNLPSSLHPTARGQIEYAKLFNEYMAAASIVWPFGYLPNGLPRNPSLLTTSAAAGGATTGAAPSASKAHTATTPFSKANALAMQQVVPKFGELAVRPDMAPADCTSASGVMAPDSLARVQGSGFQPGEVVSLTLTFNAVNSAWGTTTADANGAINAALAVPKGLAVGAYGTAEALGAGANGAGLLLTSLVRVEASATLDSDGDGIIDICDNCKNVANADQTDSDRDGYGDRCDADFDNNGIVNTLDLAILKSAFGKQGSGLTSDLDGNFTVNTLDLAIFKSLFGKKPGPSGFAK